VQNVILFDFNGVLDIKNSHEVFDHDIDYQTAKQVDPQKAAMLMRFIIEADCEFSCISTLTRYDVDVVGGMMRTVRKVEDEKMVELVSKFQETFLNNYIFDFPSNGEKNQRIREYKKSNPDANIITFEDSDPIDEEFGLIHVCSTTKLTQENIEHAKSLLK